MTQPKKGVSKLADATGKPQIANRQAAVADITVSGTYATDDTPIETAVNGILAALRAHGLIAD
jgi:hypothetical protein